MDHEFDLAFNLLDEAAGRIQQQQYGITPILFHNHGDILLTTVHDYTRDTGHHLVLLAADDHGQMAAIETTAPDLDTAPRTRILKVRAGPDLRRRARHLDIPRVGRLPDSQGESGGDHLRAGVVAQRGPRQGRLQ